MAGAGAGVRTAGRLMGDQHRLAAAAHEIGHTLAWEAAGIRVREVRLTGRGRRTGGYATTGRVEVRSRRQAHLYVVGILAGQAAQDLWCRAYRIRCTTLSCADDQEAFERHRAHEWLTSTPDETFWRDADTYVQQAWPLIAEYAPVLADRGRLTGRDLATLRRAA